ncbi:MAG: sugar transferase [Actinomycetota bacterium]|nr:sugar transferase [Actinomycetota bacterium]
MALGLATLAGFGHHHLRIVPSVAQEGGRIVAQLGVVLLAVCLLSGGGTEPMALLRSGASAIFLVVSARACLYAVIRRLRASGSLVERTLIIGAGPVGVEVAGVLLGHPEYGLAPVGFLHSSAGESLPLPVLGTAAELCRVLDDHDVRRVIVAFGPTPDPDLVSTIRSCRKASVDIHVLPRFFELGAAPPCRETDIVWGLPLVRLRRSLLRDASRRTKRLFDVTVAGALLALTLPVCAVIHALVRLSSPGPVLFRQRRVGENGHEIEVLKFRSLRLNDDSDTQWSVAADDRRTPIGSVLRKTSLDELPQLLNVLRGDMSLVGPRPERPAFVDRFSADVPRYPDRHRAPAGLTGWAQVHGLRGDTSIEERARFDNQYIEYWSLWNDIVILARTAREMVTGGERKAA